MNEQDVKDRAGIYHYGFNSKTGVKILEDLENRYHNIPSYVEGDPHGTSFREGGREVILYIRQQIKNFENIKGKDNIQDGM